MRARVLTVAVVLSLTPLAFAAAAESADDSTGERAYVVECRLIDKRSGNEQSRKGPRMTVFEGQNANINDFVQRPFVVAVSPQAGGSAKPVIEVLTVGWRVDFICHASGPDHVLLDLTSERTEITDVKEQKVSEGLTVQQPQVAIAKARRFETVRLGEPVTVPLDGQEAPKSQMCVELVVRTIGVE